MALPNDIDTTKRKRLQKTTHQQYEHLLDFVTSNKVLLTGKTNPRDVSKVTELWRTFAATLNAKGIGPPKTGEQWRNVFSEWKTNIKKKSRQIMIFQEGTGGGPPIKKTLTDLEEKLLAIISKIHLGDTMIIDTLGNNLTNIDEATEQTVLETLETSYLPDHMYCSEVSIPLLYEEGADNNENLPTTSKTPITAISFVDVPQTNEDTPHSAHNTPMTKTPSKRKRPQPASGRYTNNILADACESFCKAQETITTNEKQKADGIILVANAIQAHADAMKEKNEIEYKRLKLDYYKVFGSFDDFDKL